MAASLNDVIEVVRSIVVKLDDISSRLDGIEVKQGKNDVAVALNEKRDFNTDPGPSVSQVFTNKCVTCQGSFQTQKQSTAICEKCRLAALDKSNEQLRRFEAQGD